MEANYEVGFVINATAGGGKAIQAWESIKPLVKETYPNAYRAEETNHSGHAIDLAKTFVNEGCKLIVAIGGDGTVSHVVNGYILANGKAQGACIAMIPAGTGVDFARTIGVDQMSPIEAWNAITNGATIGMDAGKASFRPKPSLVIPSDSDDSHSNASHEGAPIADSDMVTAYFINICSIGMTADVVRRVGEAPLFKRLSRSLAYWIQGVFANFPCYPGHQVQLTWSSKSGTTVGPPSLPRDDRQNRKDENVRLYFAAICNGQYLGGGMRVAPKARLSDGQLQLVRVQDVNMLNTITCVLPGMRNGDIVAAVGPRHGAIHTCTNFHADTVSSPTNSDYDDEVCVELDGEHLGSLPLKIDALPDVLLFRIPSPTAS